MTTLVRPATIADAARLSRLGATMFRETFEGENTPDDMARYLAEAFTPDRQAAEITDPGGTAQTMWLGVWERNPRAVAFYRKYGFTRVGEHTFMLGADAQTDWVLARPLGTLAAEHGR
jgi:GNAT superfamily N-acetyltransferase